MNENIITEEEKRRIKEERRIQRDINYFLGRKFINIDIGFRCPLQCPRCQRQRQHLNHGEKVPGYDLTMSEIEKLSNFYTTFGFCGQLSDPIFHPKFPQILKLLYDKEVHCQVHNAASQKSLDWYIKCFKANPRADWIFGIDGMPEESHKYRINQDGVKLFNVMLKSKEYLKRRPTWQYIAFSYNENNIETAKKLAKKSGVKFLLVESSRWIDSEDPLKPKNNEVALNARR